MVRTRFRKLPDPPLTVMFGDLHLQPSRVQPRPRGLRSSVLISLLVLALPQKSGSGPSFVGVVTIYRSTFRSDEWPERLRVMLHGA